MPIPISARFGDNVTSYPTIRRGISGPTLLDYLETIDVESETTEKPFRFPVQWVNRPNLDFRGYAGTVVSGAIEAGDRSWWRRLVRARASRKCSPMKERRHPRRGGRRRHASHLTDEIDIARGDLLVSPTSRPEVSDQFAAHVIWMSDEALMPGRSYLARIGTKTTPITVTAHQVQDRRQHARASRGAHARAQ